MTVSAFKTNEAEHADFIKRTRLEEFHSLMQLASSLDQLLIINKWSAGMALNVIAGTGKACVVLKSAEPKCVQDALAVKIIRDLQQIVPSITASRVVLTRTSTSKIERYDVARFEADLTNCFKGLLLIASPIALIDVGTNHRKEECDEFLAQTLHGVVHIGATFVGVGDLGFKELILLEEFREFLAVIFD
jgi:hypothetical protein